MLVCFVFSSFSNRSVACLVQSIGGCSKSPPPLSPPSSPLPSPPVSSPESPLPTPPLSPQNSLLRPCSLVLSPESANEDCSAFKNHVPSPVRPKDTWEARRNSASLGASNCYPLSDQLGDNWILKNRSSSPEPQIDEWISSGPTTSYSGQQEPWDVDVANESGLGESCGSDFKASFERSFEPLVYPVEQASSDGKASTFSLDYGDDVYKGSQVSKQVIEETDRTEAEMELKEEKIRSASKVSEKALLFSQMEENVKQSAEEARANHVSKGKHRPQNDIPFFKLFEFCCLYCGVI